MQGSGMTTTEARATPFTLLVALSTFATASGTLVLDDGEQVEIKPGLGGKTTVIQYNAFSGVLSSSLNIDAYPGKILLTDSQMAKFAETVSSWFDQAPRI
jgi:hypothetical protein